MKIIRLEIENLRGLSSVHFDFEDRTNVIVGPNATGKTTILEAIRLARAVLMPRYFQETQQVLTSLGVLSPQTQFLQGYIDIGALARDPNLPVKVEINLKLSDSEIAILRSQINPIGTEILRGRMGRPDDPLALTQFLSSPEGALALNNEIAETVKKLDSIAGANTHKIQLTIDRMRGLSGGDAFLQTCITVLERSQRPSHGLFSYFPADRAFPSGEVGVQLGSNESSQQIQSHVGVPASKYQRLKQIVVNSFIVPDPSLNTLAADFELVLDALLPGKKLAGMAVTPAGLLRVGITETASGKTYDIDTMSSGEKGLLLTFLLIRRTVGPGGIVLIDEPELHLNPAVCKKLIPFLNDIIAKPNDIQTILCTHSAEILGQAFERGDCGVYHLRSHKDATRIYERDNREVFEALKRLGTSAADSLFSNGNLFVEGEHDSAVLEEGFFDLVSGFKITDLGGRAEVEKEIAAFQAAERRNELGKLHCFIFDLDRKATKLANTKLVRVLQWDRTCLENYLLGSKILYDALSQVGAKGLPSRGEFESTVRGLAMDQLNEVAARNIYKGLEPENPGLRPSELAKSNLFDIAEKLVDRLITIKTQLAPLDRAAWVQHFVERADSEAARLKDEWSASWIRLCDGKKVIDDLYKTYQINLGKLDLKKLIVRLMAAEQTEDWQLIKTKLRDALAP
jgi:predicted ATPase